MHNSSPPTLLDRLTRFDKHDDDQAQAQTPGGRRTSQAPLPILDDLINEAHVESVRPLTLSGVEDDAYRVTEYRPTEYRPTDFAITNINVPDRLDLREVRDRAEEEYKRPGLFSFDRYLLGLWIRRIVWLTVLGFLGFWGYRTALPIRDDLSAERISQRLSTQSGLKVQVADVAYRVTPSPRIVLLGVQLGDDLRMDEVAIRLNWQDTWNALISGKLSLGEATISPLRLSQEQVWSLLDKMSALTKALPESLFVLRFDSVEVSDAPLIKGHYELTLRRVAGGKFGPIQVAPVGAEPPFRLLLKNSPALDAPAGAPPRFAFQFDANSWVLPFGPGAKWGEVVANGYITPGFIEVESYLLAGTYGVIRGALYAASDVQWALTGYARGTGLDIETIVAATAKVVRAEPGEKAEANPVPFSGTATLDLALVGSGDSLAEAVDKGVAAGPVQVRWASIKGVNLGYAATHGGSDRGLGGGFTRFSDFEAMLLASPEGFVFRDIVARAGAMTTRGELRMDPDNSLKGVLRVDMGATRVQAPISLKVRGTLLAPQFVR